jgi:hypothetical protein
MAAIVLHVAEAVAADDRAAMDDDAPADCAVFPDRDVG